MNTFKIILRTSFAMRGGFIAYYSFFSKRLLWKGWGRPDLPSLHGIYSLLYIRAYA